MSGETCGTLPELRTSLALFLRLAVARLDSFVKLDFSVEKVKRNAM